MSTTEDDEVAEQLLRRPARRRDYRFLTARMAATARGNPM
jgi:hypothetical protein